MENKKLLSNLVLLLVALIWGGGFVVTKNTLDIMDPIYLIFLRFGVSAVIISLIFFRKFKNISKEDIKAGGTIGSILFMAFLIQTLALQFTTVSKQAFIIASNVVMVPFIIWIIYRKKPDKYELLAALVCFIGIGFLSMENRLTLGLGTTMTLVSAIFYGLHIVTVGKYSKLHDPITLTIVQFIVATILAFIAALMTGLDFVPITREMAKGVIYMGLVSTVVAFALQNVAQQYTTTNTAALILSLESVFGAIFSYFFLGEDFTIRIIIGCLSIFSAIIIAETKLKGLRKKLTIGKGDSDQERQTS